MYFEFLVSPLATHGVTRSPRFRGISFTAGRHVPETAIAQPLVFPADTTAENPPPDFTQMGIPVMSERLVAALQQAGVDNLQLFEAVLKNEDTGEEWTGYKAVNILGLVACADLRHSSGKEMGGGLYSFDALVVDPTKVHGELFFRLAESPSRIIAHKSVGDHLYGPNCPKMTGFRFWPTDAATVAKLRAP